MPRRSTQSAIQSLLEEARAIELLMSEADPNPSQMSDYWDISMRLINLMVDIEAGVVEHPQAAADDPQYRELRRRLSALENEVLDITRET